MQAGGYVYSGIPKGLHFPGGFPSKGFARGSDSKESACNVGDMGSIPELRDLGLIREPGEGNSYLLQ